MKLHQKIINKFKKNYYIKIIIIYGGMQMSIQRYRKSKVKLYIILFFIMIFLLWIIPSIVIYGFF